MFSVMKALKKEVTLMFVGSFILLLALQVISYWSLTKSDEAKAQLNRSTEIRIHLMNIFSSMKDVETGLRGFALTNKKSFLEPYTEGVPSVNANYAALSRLIVNPAMKQELLVLKELAARRIEIAQNIIDIQHEEGIESARRVIAEEAGKRAMDALREQVDKMIDRERELLENAQKNADAANNFSRIVFMIGFVVVLGLQSMAFSIVVREVSQRRAAEEEALRLNRQLEGHIAELDNEIGERRKAEAAVKELNEQLNEQIDLMNETNTTLNAVNRELESFAYSVSHDLRSPLRGLDGLSLALLEDYGDKIDPLGKSFLERMRSESQRMGELIDGILSLSRLTRGDFHRQEVNLSEIANRIADNLRKEEPDRQVAIDIQPDMIAEADARLIEAVLQNLLNNAWKFTSKHDSGHIEFGREQKEGKIVYYVKDDGAGFDMAYLDKMFGAFQRLHGVNEFPGTGIGLATVQRIIHRHGGVIWAEGAPEQGAQFYFTLS